MPDDFETLVRRHQSAVCASAYSVLRDRGRSEEVAQDAFLLAWQKLPAMEPPPVMPGWICGIAKNLARNAGRRRREVALDADVPGAATPLDAVLEHETAAQVEHALGELADDDREVVVLYYRGEQSIADVAQILAITEPTARKRLQRGRDRLRSALAAVEASLRATRPGPAFTAACVAALAAGVGVRAAAAAETARAGAKLAPIAIAAGVAFVLAIGGAVWWTQRAPGSPPRTARAESVSSPGDAATAATAANADGPRALVRKLDPSAHDALVASLRAAHGRRRRADLPPISPADIKVYDFSGSVLEPVAASPSPPGPLSKTTIRAAIRAMQPYLLECTAAAAHPMRGTLEVKLRLSGDPDVGTLVESVDLGGDAMTTADPELVTCLTETLMALELAPMDVPGTWDVNYPFVVR